MKLYLWWETYTIFTFTQRSVWLRFGSQVSMRRNISLFLPQNSNCIINLKNILLWWHEPQFGCGILDHSSSLKRSARMSGTLWTELVFYSRAFFISNVLCCTVSIIINFQSTYKHLYLIKLFLWLWSKINKYFDQ